MTISTAVDSSAVARVVGIETKFADLRAGGVQFLPQQVALLGQGNSAAVYSTDKVQYTSAAAVAAVYGFGSPLHLAALQLFPINGDGIGTVPLTIYPLVDDGAGAPSVGDITPGGAPTTAASYVVRINNIDSETFVISVGDSVADIVAAMTAAINGSLNLPVTAVDNAGAKCDVTSKWEGVSTNDLFVEVVGATDAGNTFGITQPVGGLVNPSITTALAQVGNVWETMGLNCLDIADTDILDELSDFGEGRWGALVQKPLVFFTGNTATSVANATVVSDARKLDRVNAQLVAPGSNDLPFVVAARQLARIVKLANTNPPHDYGGRPATGLTPGADGDQWTYADRDSALKKGSSTIEVENGVIEVSDVVTFYHPDGDPTPAYRYVVDIVKVQNIIFNLGLIFKGEDWNGAPLIPDDQATVNPAAKQPKAAVAEVRALIDSLALQAIISDPDSAKASTVAEIDAQNPKRLNATTTMAVSGNTNIISIDFNFGFFFGTPEVV